MCVGMTANAQATQDITAHKQRDTAERRLDNLRGSDIALAQREDDKRGYGDDNKPAVDLLHRLDKGLNLHGAINLAKREAVNGIAYAINLRAEQHSVARHDIAQNTTDNRGTDNTCQGCTKHIECADTLGKVVGEG